MPQSIPNFLNQAQTPLGLAFGNLSRVLMSQPTEAESLKAADEAVLSRWKLKGMQGLGEALAGGFPTGAPSTVGTGATPASGSIASRISGLAPAASAEAPSGEMEGPSPIATAFQSAVPAAPQPSIDYGAYARDALFAGLDPSKAGGYTLLGNANTYGARDARTINSAVGAGQGYGTTAESFDIGQNNDLTQAREAQAAQDARNAANIEADNAQAAANRSNQYAIAQLQESGEDRRAGEKEKKADDKEKLKAQAIANSADVVLGKVDEALNQVGFLTSGTIGGVSSNIPGSSAYTLDRTIDTIKANLSFDALAAMRAASPTGGALGSITEKELGLLGSTVANLDVGLPPSKLRENLAQVKKHYQNIKNLQAGRMPASDAPSAPAPAADASGAPVDDDLDNLLKQYGQ